MTHKKRKASSIKKSIVFILENVWYPILPLTHKKVRLSKLSQQKLASLLQCTDGEAGDDDHKI